MTSVLRYIGILNAAIWCGASIFLIIALPAVFSDQLKTKIGVMGPVGVGWAAEAIFARYFILQYCCAGLGLVHLVLEWMYCGKPLLQKNLGILLALLTIALVGGLWMQPKMTALHNTKYFAKAPEERVQADSTFKAWHATSECVNLVTMAGLLLYLWRISQSAAPTRYGSLNLDKVRG